VTTVKRRPALALVELVHILEWNAAHDAAGDAGGSPGSRLEALHMRYADDGDDRYRVVARCRRRTTAS